MVLTKHRGMNMISNSNVTSAYADTRELSFNELDLVSGGDNTQINFGNGITLIIFQNGHTELCTPDHCYHHAG
jgi:hypothetical protein